MSLQGEHKRNATGGCQVSGTTMIEHAARRLTLAVEVTARLQRLPPANRQSATAATQPPRFELPPPGSNQGSPDPEGALKHPKFQQLATLYASSCHPMLGFAGFHAGLRRTLLTQMVEFVTPSTERLCADPTTCFSSIVMLPSMSLSEP